LVGIITHVLRTVSTERGWRTQNSPF